MLINGPGSTLIETRRDAVAEGLRGAREARDVSGEDAHAGAVDRDRDGRVVVARAPQRIDDRPRNRFPSAGRARRRRGAHPLQSLESDEASLNSRSWSPLSPPMTSTAACIGNRRRGDGRRKTFVPIPKSKKSKARALSHPPHATRAAANA